MNPSSPFTPQRVRLRALLIALTAALAAAPAAAQDTLSLLSTNSQRTASANGESHVEAVSADGRFVAFTSDATNLMPFPDTNNAPDLFVFDRLQSRVGLVSVSINSANSYANGASGRLRPDSTVAFSADGRYLVYESNASDIVHFDTNNATDVFALDLAIGVNILVSAKGNDHQAPANGPSFKPVIGNRTVVFLSAATDASPTPDTNGKTDVFARRLDLLQTEMVSVNAAGTNGGNEHSSLGAQPPAVSADGRFVAFESEAGDLVPNDTNGGGAFGTDVFVRDLQSDATALASVNSAGTGSGNQSSFGSGATISADGRFVVFASNATDLVAGVADNNGNLDIFIRDRVANTTALVSVALSGASAGNNLSQFHAVSADGRHVAFTSRASNLVPVDTNNGLEGGGGIEDVFVRDVQAGTTELVSLNAAGTDSGNSSSGGPVRISRDGRLVLFTSGATNLTGVGDFNNTPELLVRDTQADSTTLVSVDKFGNAGGARAGSFYISDDNRVIAFDSESNLLTHTIDVNFKSDVFARAPAPPSLSVGDASVVEGNTGTKDAVFTVTLAGAATGPVTVDAITFGISAHDPHDYQPVSVKLTFAPGETSKTVAVPVIGDAVYEGDETFSLQLRNVTGGAVAADDFGTGTIVEDDPLPSLSVNDVTVTEGDSGLKKVTFTVTLSGQSARSAVFQVSTAGGTATAQEDFLDISGGGLIAPGLTSTSFEVNIVGDTVDEPDETFFLNISNPTDATIADGQGFATITDDETGTGAPTVQFTVREHTVGEGAGRIDIVVTRTGDLAAPGTVEYATSSFLGSFAASDRGDYTAAYGRLSFAAGESSKTFTVFITDDVFVDADERFLIALGNPTGAASLGSPSSGVVRITDNDAAPSTANPSDTSEFFVRQHYRDFLNREPDAGGLAFWVGGIESCGADQQCREVKRVDTSAAFFLSIEFQETGFLVYRVHKAAFGDLNPPAVPVPVRLRPFLFDSRLVGEGIEVGVGDWQAQLEAKKNAYLAEFVARPEFVARYPQALPPAQFVDALNANAGGALSQTERDALVAALTDGTMTRAQVLRAVAEDETLRQAETNRAFVLMQYFGYLRRNPDDPQDTNFNGYNFWLQKLNQFNGNFVRAEMVRAFITSIEYRQRFGQ